VSQNLVVLLRVQFSAKCVEHHVHPHVLESACDIVPAQRALLGVLQKLLEHTQFTKRMPALEGYRFNELLKAHATAQIRRKKLFDQRSLYLLERGLGVYYTLYVQLNVFSPNLLFRSEVLVSQITPDL